MSDVYWYAGGEWSLEGPMYRELFSDAGETSRYVRRPKFIYEQRGTDEDN